MKNILIIWDGENDLEGFRLECVQRVKEIYPDIPLICITKDQKLLPGIIEYLSWDSMEKLLWERWFVKSNEVKVLSEYFRYLFLSQNPHTLYLDTDIYLHEPIKETNYIGKWKNDYSAMWNGDECRFFHEIVHLRNSNGSLTRILKFWPDDYIDLGKYMTHKTKER